MRDGKVNKKHGFTRYRFAGTRSAGFTLIELLVVVAIIGLLASIIILSLGNARLKARDARRISDLEQLKNALELYYNQCGLEYPSALDTSANNGCPVGTNLGSYMSQIISNPGGCTIVGGTAPSGSGTVYGYTPGVSNQDYTVYFCSEGPIGGTPIIAGGSSHTMVQGKFAN